MDNNNWTEWRLHLIEEIRHLRDEIEMVKEEIKKESRTTRDEQKTFLINQIELKTQMKIIGGFWGMISGALTGLITAVILMAIKKQ